MHVAAIMSMSRNQFVANRPFLFILKHNPTGKWRNHRFVKREDAECNQTQINKKLTLCISLKPSSLILLEIRWLWGGGDRGFCVRVVKVDRKRHEMLLKNEGDTCNFWVDTYACGKGL